MSQDTPTPKPSARFWYLYKRYPYLLAKITLFGMVIYGIVWALQNVQSVLFPLFLSLLIAYCLDPVVDWFEARKVSRPFAILILISIGLLSTTLFVLILYPELSRQLRQVTDKLPQLITILKTDVFPWAERRLGVEVPANLAAVMAEYGDELQRQIPELTKKAGSWVGTALSQTGSLVTSLLNTVMVPVFTFYFLRDFDRMKDPLEAYIPPHRKPFVMSRIKRMDEVVGAWFRGQVEVALILAVLYALGLGVVFHFAGLGVMTGVAIGVMSGLLNVIPYFGFLIGIILASLMVLLNWQGPGAFVGVGAVFLIIQLLEGYLITPRIVGDKVGLSPVTVIIVLLLGGELFGLLGVLLALPIAGILRALLPDIITYYRSTPFFTNEHYEPGSERDWMSTISMKASEALAASEDSKSTGGETPEDIDSSKAVDSA